MWVCVVAPSSCLLLLSVCACACARVCVEWRKVEGRRESTAQHWWWHHLLFSFFSFWHMSSCIPSFFSAFCDHFLCPLLTRYYLAFCFLSILVFLSSFCACFSLSLLPRPSPSAPSEGYTDPHTRAHMLLDCDAPNVIYSNGFCAFLSNATHHLPTTQALKERCSLTRGTLDVFLSTYFVHSRILKG